MQKHATKEWIKWRTFTKTYLMRHFVKGISVRSGFNHVSAITEEYYNIFAHNLGSSCLDTEA